MTIESNDEKLTVWLPEQDKLEVREFSGVNLIMEDGNSEISVVGKEIIVETAIANISYSIGNINGLIIAAGALPIGLSTISLSSYQPGIYIITIDKKSFKVHIK